MPVLRNAWFDRARATSPVWVFLGAYAATAVLGIVLYMTPWGQWMPGMSIPDWTGHFPVDLGPEFWMLIALPFLVAPPIALGVGRGTRRLATWISPAIPEIPPPIYLAMCATLYGFVIVALTRAEAISALLSPQTAVGAVQARFDLLARLSFPETMVLKSLLVFLAVYSIIRANRDRSLFWVACACINMVLMVACLSLLAMKWPAVLFVLTAALAVFISARGHAVLASAALAVSGLALYLVLSIVILHLAPAAGPQDRVAAQPSPSASLPRATRLGSTAVGAAPHLMAVAVNRMAIALPYYYSFHKRHPDCPQGLVLLYPKRPLSCEPTLLVYTDLFGQDGFQGIGTAPAAVQMYGYALAGWPGAIVSLGFAALILGLFIALWPAAQTSSIYAAGLAMGGYTAYNFSQLPVEGPLIYDHGMWWVFLVLGWTAAFWIWRFARMRSASSLARPIFLTIAFLFVAYEMVWITWVIATDYDDMPLGQQAVAEKHFPSDVWAFVFGPWHP